MGNQRRSIMKPLNDLLGKRFGRLEVIARDPNLKTPNGTHRTMWRCRCDCGKETSVVASNLSRKDRKATTSCGCLRLEAVASKDWMGVEFRRYALANSKRGRRSKRVPEFRLSVDEFSKLILDNCNYCGQKPDTKSHVGGHLRNGIDRVDNAKDYIAGNVVTCCGSCNRLKGSFDVNEFKNLCSKISKFQSQFSDKTS
jgi:hypothetical protein